MVEKFTKLGFILAMAGSTVGLGNAWKFPTMTGNNGGSAFILLYLILNFTIIIVAFMAELAIGRIARSDVANSMFKLAPSHKKAWSMSGLFMLTAIFISSFYMLVIGWIFYYVCLGFTALPSKEMAGGVFENLLYSNFTSAFLCFTIVFFIVFYSVARGIKSGIEKLNLWMMPLLVVLLVVIVIYSVFQGDHFIDAVKFLFIPDFSKMLDPNIILQALGLSLFSLSMGVGTVLTYGSSLPDNSNLTRSTMFIILINLVVSILMGLIVFTFIPIVAGQPASDGPGLIFISLTSLFSELGASGNYIAVAFFISLLFAGITSAVSMIEPMVLYFINQFKFTRIKSILIIGVFVYILGLLCVVSYYKETSAFLSIPAGAIGNEKSIAFFDILDFITSNIFMPIGVLVFSIFVGWVMSKEKLYELFETFMSKKGFEIWLFVLKFIVPIVIITISVYTLIKN